MLKSSCKKNIAVSLFFELPIVPYLDNCQLIISGTFVLVNPRWILRLKMVEYDVQAYSVEKNSSTISVGFASVARRSRAVFLQLACKLSPTPLRPVSSMAAVNEASNFFQSSWSF